MRKWAELNLSSYLSSGFQIFKYFVCKNKANSTATEVDIKAGSLWTPEETLEFRENRNRPGIQDGHREKQQLRSLKNHVCAAQTNIPDQLTSKAALIWRVENNKNLK